MIDDIDYEVVFKHRWSTWFDKRKNTYQCPKSSINGKSTILSRFLLKPDKGLQVDHINRDVLDNRRKNLRICDNSVNGHNRGIFKTNKTGYAGVHYDKYHKKYRAEIKIMNKKYFLGYFSTPIEAHKAYVEKYKV